MITRWRLADEYDASSFKLHFDFDFDFDGVYSCYDLEHNTDELGVVLSAQSQSPPRSNTPPRIPHTSSSPRYPTYTLTYDYPSRLGIGVERTHEHVPY